eukprot:1193705-Prorocentrum_minimum.AAC.2
MDLGWGHHFQSEQVVAPTFGANLLNPHGRSDYRNAAEVRVGTCHNSYIVFDYNPHDPSRFR